MSALFKAIIFNLPEIIKGLAKGGRPTNNPHIKIVPADFLIDVDGRIVELHYGKNTADHIPLKRLQRFASRRKKKSSRRKMEAELKKLRRENAQLKANSKR